MVTVYVNANVAADKVRFMILAFGSEHTFRVLTVDEVAHEFPNVKKDVIRSQLDELAREELVTRFAGRYCFNKTIPDDILRLIEENVTRSGTIKAK